MGKALEAVPVQIEITARRKEETVERVPPLHQYYQLCLDPTWTQEFCPMLVGARRQYVRAQHGMSRLRSISHRVLKQMNKSILAGAQQHQQCPPRPLQAGGVGRAMQALNQAGENKDPPLVGTAKFQEMEEVGRVAGMMDLTATPGATTSTKTTGPILGLMHPSLSRPGMETVVKAGEAMEKLQEPELATTGGILQKVQAL